MLLLLPVAAYILFFLALRKHGIDWRRAFLVAAILVGLSVVGITETLSVFRLVTRTGTGISWFAVCLIGALWLFFVRPKPSKPEPVENFAFDSLDGVTKGLLAGTAVIAILVLIVALVSPPNVWDSMEYHLPRVSMWMSNHSVQFYTTPDFNQLILSPWAEFAMMHTELLSGSDRFVNLVEFCSFIGCLVGVSLIAKMFGAGPKGQAFAAIVCATIPEGILEASGPMNTYVGAFWCMTTIVFLLSWNEDPLWLYIPCIGLSTGIAVLTKGTSYIWLPFVIASCWWIASKAQRIRFAKLSPIIIVLIVAVNAPQYLRNYGATGSPLGVPLPDFPRLQLTITHVSVTRTLANSIRNVSLHLGTPSQRVNDEIEHFLRKTIREIGSDPDDPEATWLGGPFFMSHSSFHEVHAGNPLHLLLLAIAIGISLWSGVRGSGRSLAIYSVGLVASFLFFSALVRWAQWSSRYQMPLFVLGAGLVGVVLERYFNKRITHAFLILLVLAGISFALLNRTRSLVPWNRVADVYHPRDRLYFSDQHESIADANIAAAAAVKTLACQDVAIDSYVESAVGNTPVSFYVYPMLALLHVDGETRRAWYSGVNNRSSHYGDWESHRSPCAVICLGCARVSAKWAEYSSLGGKPLVFDYIVVFTTRNTTSDAVSHTP